MSNTKWVEWKSSLVEGKNPCYRCRKNGRDRSGDNFHYYGEDGGGYCNSCTYTIPSKEFRTNPSEEEVEWSINIMAKEFTLSQWKELIKNCSSNPKGYRGLTKETCEAYQVQHEYNTETGKLEKQYYPMTKGYKYSGIKARTEPKDFYSLGETGKECELFGQWKFKNSASKFVVITAGELDCLSGYQMLNSKQSDYEDIPVVSPTTGESSSVKQLQGQYEWLDKFEKIILCYDNDEAGKKALEKVVKGLPKGKVFVMKLSLKDTNDYLTKGRIKEWVNLFWRAEKYVPSGIIGSSGMYDLILERAKTEKVTLPAFMRKMQKMMAGGFPLKSIINLTAASGQGKTVYINEMVLHWIFHSPYKVGVCSLEADMAEYGENLLSRYIGKKIALFENINEKMDFLSDDTVAGKARELFTDDEGNPRFYLNDDRGDFESLTSKVEQMVIECGVQIVIIDPTSDALAGFSNEQVELFMQWQKKLTKSHDVCIINIMHSRKAASGEKAGSTGGMISEESIIGHSSQYKSASANIILIRNKMAEDEVERNTTKVFLAKCRWTGNTGLATEVYYDNKTHTLYDKEDYLMDYPVETEPSKF